MLALWSAINRSWNLNAPKFLLFTEDIARCAQSSTKSNQSRRWIAVFLFSYPQQVRLWSGMTLESSAPTSVRPTVDKAGAHWPTASCTQRAASFPIIVFKIKTALPRLNENCSCIQGILEYILQYYNTNKSSEHQRRSVQWTPRHWLLRLLSSYWRINLLY